MLTWLEKVLGNCSSDSASNFEQVIDNLWEHYKVQTEHVWNWQHVLFYLLPFIEFQTIVILRRSMPLLGKPLNA